VSIEGLPWPRSISDTVDLATPARAARAESVISLVILQRRRFRAIGSVAPGAALVVSLSIIVKSAD